VAHAAAHRVDLQVAEPDHGRLGAVAAPRERLQPRQELVEGERLRQVVVGAGLQPAHAVLDRVERGQDEHVHVLAGGTQAAQDLEPLDARQHEIQHHDVVGSAARHPQADLAIGRGVDLVARSRQQLPQRLDHLGRVLDEQDAHGRGGPLQAKPPRGGRPLRPDERPPPARSGAHNEIGRPPG
jgi:hypothetical protein